MKTSWSEAGRTRKMVAPLSLIVSAFAPVRDVRRTLTPQLRTDRGETSLLLIDLGAGRNRLGGSCLAQVYGSLGRDAPDCDDPQRLASFFAAIAELRARGLRARVSRSLRRRPVRDARRDGIRRSLRPRRRSRRRTRGGRGGAVQRRARRGAAGSRERCASRARSARASRPRVAARASIGTRDERRSRAHSRRRQASCSTKSRTALRRAWSETSFRMIAAARQSRSARASSSRPRSTRTIPACTSRLTFDPQRRHRGAVHRHGRAAEGRDPARAGRQQPGRDGGGVPSRRLRRRSTCT